MTAKPARSEFQCGPISADVLVLQGLRLVEAAPLRGPDLTGAQPYGDLKQNLTAHGLVRQGREGQTSGEAIVPAEGEVSPCPLSALT